VVVLVIRSPLAVNRRRRFGGKRWPDGQLRDDLVAICGAGAIEHVLVIRSPLAVNRRRRFGGKR
jgi:hypothetical protein